MSANTIVLSGDYRKVQSKVLATGQTPYPGMMVKLNSSDQWTVHATEGGDAEVALVLEDALQGKTVSDAYTAGTICDVGVIPSGTEVQVLVVAGENIAIGDQLMSAGTGKFKEKTSTYKPLFTALEAADLSVSGAVDTLVKARRI